MFRRLMEDAHARGRQRIEDAGNRKPALVP
jgi:hypothetical protein